jgi:hypothetical protein
MKSLGFGIADLMILIAAIGVGMASGRSVLLGLRIDLIHPSGYPLSSRIVIEAMIAAWLSPLTMACLAIRIRRRKPSWRRTAILPGTASSIACAVVIVARTSLTILYHVLYDINSYIKTHKNLFYFSLRSCVDGIINHIYKTPYDPINHFTIESASLSVPCGYAIVAVWILLAVSGRLRIEKSWIDLFGRVLGTIWILLAIVTAFSPD